MCVVPPLTTFFVRPIEFKHFVRVILVTSIKLCRASICKFRWQSLDVHYLQCYLIYSWKRKTEKKKTESMFAATTNWWGMTELMCSRRQTPETKSHWNVSFCCSTKLQLLDEIWRHWLLRVGSYFGIGWTTIEKSRPELDPKWIRLCNLLPTGSSWWWRHLRWKCKDYRGLWCVKFWSC